MGLSFPGQDECCSKIWDVAIVDMDVLIFLFFYGCVEFVDYVF